MGQTGQKMRIVSLLPSATEIVGALGLAGDLVGVSHECDYPPDAIAGAPTLTAPKINPAAMSAQIDRDVRAIVEKGLSVYNVDAERLRELKPDIIITQSHCEVCAVSESDVVQAVADWTGARPIVLSLSPMTLDDIFADIQRAADALNAADRGAALVKRLRDGLDELRAQTAGEPPKTVFFMEWIDPLMGAGNWMPALWRAAGGQIVLGADGEHSPYCDWDDLRRSDPQFIVVGPCGFDIARARAELEPVVAAKRAVWRELSAVKAGAVFITDGNQYYNRPGPRVLESAQIAAEILHPNLIKPKFKDAGWQAWSEPRAARAR